MTRATANGGFPLPLVGEPARVLAAHHDGCGGNTRVRLPRAVPARAVRRVVCDRCTRDFEPVAIEDASSRVAPLPGAWRWLSLPVAGLAVLGTLYVVQGDGETGPPPAPVYERAGGKPAGGGVKPGGGGNRATANKDALLVSESTFALALPAGWRRTAPSGGATFAAVAPGGEADARLWIERDPKLDFATFEARSLAQLESLAGSAGIVERDPGPTAETTSVRIAPTSAPPGAPNYEVLLRASGDYWYYLATTSQPGAAPETVDGVELMQGSFLPQGAAR